MRGGPGGLYRVLPGTHPGPIFSLFLAQGPTHGQMKLNNEILMRFPRMGPERVQI